METPRAQALRAEVEARVKPFCEGWSAVRLAEVVDHIVAVTLKYDRIITKPVVLNTGFSERMIVQMNELADRSVGLRDELRTD
jgi:hypothetical protein